MLRLAALPLLLLAVAAHAVEIPLDSPSFALPERLGGDGLRYVRYDLPGLTAELTTASLRPHWGYWDIANDSLPDGSVTPFVESVSDCGNDDSCAPIILTFSVPVSSATVAWDGVGNYGSGAIILSSAFWLEAWSEPFGEGVLLAGVFDPGGEVEQDGDLYPFPVTLSLSHAGIRSIVFSADALTSIYPDEPFNLSDLASVVVVVPEPRTGWMVAVGLVAISRRRRKA